MYSDAFQCPNIYSNYTLQCVEKRTVPNSATILSTGFRCNVYVVFRYFLIIPIAESM